MIVIVLFIILYNFKRLDGNCEGEDGVSCCSGFKRDAVSNQCIECTVGYFGINCSQQCPFPSYGRHCQKECDCSSDLCDVSNGCLDTGSNLHSSPEVSKIIYNLKPLTRRQNKTNSSFGETNYYPATSTSILVVMYTSKKISQKDSKNIQYTVLGDIKPILYAMFSVILLCFTLIAAYIIRKKIRNSQCNKHQVDGDGNVHDTGIYQEINSYNRFNESISYSVCRENSEEALEERSESVENQVEFENDGGKVFTRDNTEVKSTSVF